MSYGMLLALYLNVNKWFNLYIQITKPDLLDI